MEKPSMNPKPIERKKSNNKKIASTGCPSKFGGTEQYSKDHKSCEMVQTCLDTLSKRSYWLFRLDYFQTAKCLKTHSRSLISIFAPKTRKSEHSCTRRHFLVIFKHCELCPLCILSNVVCLSTDAACGFSPKSSNVEEEKENQRKFTSQKLSHQKVLRLRSSATHFIETKKFASR